MARSLGFYGDGISFQVALANHSNSESFLVAHASLRQDGFREVDGQAVSPLDLSELFQLAVAY